MGAIPAKRRPVEPGAVFGAHGAVVRPRRDCDRHIARDTLDGSMHMGASPGGRSLSLGRKAAVRHGHALPQTRPRAMRSVADSGSVGGAYSSVRRIINQAYRLTFKTAYVKVSRL